MPATEAQQQKTEEKTEETKEQVKASVDFTADRESSKAEEARGVAKAKLTPADEEGQQLMGDGEGGFRPMTDFEKEYLRKELEEQDQEWQWDNKTAQEKPEERKEQVSSSVDFKANRESNKAGEMKEVAQAKFTPADEEGQQMMGDGEGGFRPMTDFEKEHLRKELEEQEQATKKPEAESAPQADAKAGPPAEPAKVALRVEAAAEPEESASAEAKAASPSQPKAEAADATPKAETLAEPKAEPAKAKPQAAATAEPAAAATSEPAAAATAQKVEDQAESKAEAKPSSDVGAETAASPPKVNPSSDAGTETAASPKAAGAAEGALQAGQQSSARAVSAGGLATACLALLWVGPLL
uniref:Uncharacterized protein n=1 Tax=Alexandrium monilatum TaxID=311494 RepID=A0A7S4VV87_9DINO